MLVGGGGSPSSVYSINGIFMGLACIMVAARCYVRHFLIRAFSKEDWLAVIALIGYIFMCISNIMLGIHGSGSHMADLTPQEQADGLMWWWILELLYIPTSILVKMSVVCVCLRLVEKRSYIIALHSINAVMIIYGIIFICLNTFQCRPINLFWKAVLGADTTDKCLSPYFVGDLQLVYSALNAGADILLSVVSCALVYKIHLPTGGDKASVIVVLAFGVLACCAVIIRIPFLVSLKIGFLDFLFYTTDVINWSTVEVGLGIIATAGSSLRPLVRTIISRSRFIGTSVDPTSTRWKRARDHEGYLRSGAAPAGTHSRCQSEDVEKIEMFPVSAGSKAGATLGSNSMC